MALGLGMGVPLLAVGASAGRFLPKAGHWMEAVNRFFGVVMLGMAIWFLDRIVPPPVTLALWALLLIGTAIFWGALDSMDRTVTVWDRIRKGVGLAMLVYGGTLIIGAAAGGTSVWQPLKGIGLGRNHEGLRFTTVKGLDGLRGAVAQAQRAAKPTAVDFYADWCVECKDMERDTFSDAEVRKLMSRASLIKIDVTANDAKDREVLKEFELYGPPAMLFFGADGQERRAHRLIGYKAPPEFKLHAELGLKP
jgi:thiol:disulfide interchange protein DsbD